jgi:hypothetical protein
MAPYIIIVDGVGDDDWNYIIECLNGTTTMAADLYPGEFTSDEYTQIDEIGMKKMLLNMDMLKYVLRVANIAPFLLIRIPIIRYSLICHDLRLDDHFNEFFNCIKKRLRYLLILDDVPDASNVYWKLFLIMKVCNKDIDNRIHIRKQFSFPVGLQRVRYLTGLDDLLWCVKGHYPFIVKVDDEHYTLNLEPKEDRV